MSTVAPPVSPSQHTGEPARRSAAEQLIEQRIEEARRALWWSELTRTCLMVVIGSMLALLVWLVMDHWFYSPGRLVRSISFVSLVAVACWFLIRRAWPVMTSRVTREYAAWALEQDHPDYRQQLTSYVTLRDDQARRGIRARVVKVIGTRAASLLKSHDMLPREATGTFKWWITAAAVFALLAAYCVASPKSSLASAKRLAAPLASIDPARRVKIDDVRPGDAEALAGRELEVSAAVDGLRNGEAVMCRWSGSGTTQESELVLDPSSNRFTGTLRLDHAASGIVRYTVAAGDAVAGPFELSVENVPVVAVESVRYQPPEYTRRKPRTTSSPAITAIDGTKIRITAKTNRPIARAELQFNPKPLGDTVRATAGRMPIAIGDDGVTLTADVTLRCARGKTASVELESYRIRVWDSNDQSNPDPIVYPIKVIADLPPEVAIVVPKKSPIEIPVGAQQIIEVHAMDADFELERVTLRIERGIDTLEDPVIWVKPEDGSGKGNQVMEYRFRPLEHLLRAGDVVRISATAIDNRMIPGDQSVQPNQTTTDPIEIRIVDDAEPLPEDPTGNDGLSRPDDRPASDVEKSQQGDGQQNSGEGGQGQGSTGQGETGQGDQSQQNGGGEGAAGEPSGEQQEPDQGDQGGSSPQSSGGENASGENMGKDAQGQSSDQPASGDQGGDPSGEQQSEPNDTGNNETGNNETGSDPSDATQTDAQRSPQGQGDQNAADGASGDPSGQSPSGDQGSGTPKTDGSERQSDGGADAPRGESDGAGRTGKPDGQGGQSGSDAPEPGSEPSSAPPEHDGQAFERIKDFIEKQKQNQNRSQEDSAAGKSDPSKQDGGDSQSGDSQTGDAENADSETGDAGDRPSQTEQADASENSQTSKSSDPGSDARDSADGQKTEQGSGDSKSPQGESSDGQEGGESGDATQSDSEGGQPGSNEQESGEQGSGEQIAGEQKAGDGPESESRPGDSPRQPGDQEGQPSGGDRSSDQRSDATGESNSSQSTNSPTGPSESPSESSGSQGTGTGASDDAADSGAETPPEPDLEYAKKATDMVLDYLDETRDQVDEDLLKELDWTEQDLQRFRERWEKVRQLEQPTQQGESTDELQDALRSLGLQQRQGPSQSARESADSLRNLRDSGNRRKAPPAIRDAFDAFRRRR
ncbi:hypothetical protein Mal15_02930 [Stieleria maiorica]|uniref:Uncharacterized protein n=1 Tax=Stieleria maiorica TaxID=2795974 RepID=A0A5B9M7Y9_9BACT|nr:hypothetical protein [Stieleria maiorica]QEF96266.1 hypothetical protein Mal15_02930 [Stieleria maiorica]